MQSNPSISEKEPKILRGPSRGQRCHELGDNSGKPRILGHLIKLSLRKHGHLRGFELANQRSADKLGRIFRQDRADFKFRFGFAAGCDFLTDLLLQLSFGLGHIAGNAYR